MMIEAGPIAVGDYVQIDARPRPYVDDEERWWRVYGFSMVTPDPAPGMPFGPLDHFLGCFTENVPGSRAMNTKRYLIRDIAALAGVATRNVCRWREKDIIPSEAADRIACSYGVHPCVIWPQYHAWQPTDDELGLNLSYVEGARRLARREGVSAGCVRAHRQPNEAA